jgi:hypothetical protein
VTFILQACSRPGLSGDQHARRNASMAKRPAIVESANLTHIQVLQARTWRPAPGGATPVGHARAISLQMNHIQIGSLSVVSIF